MTLSARITQAPAGGPGISLPATKKFYQQSYRGAPRTMARPGQPKDYGINTGPSHKAILYSVSFWLTLSAPVMNASKFFVMEQQLIPVTFKCRRKWVSSTSSGVWQCYPVLVVWRAPVIGGFVHWHLRWQHKVILVRS